MGGRMLGFRRKGERNQKDNTGVYHRATETESWSVWGWGRRIKTLGKGLTNCTKFSGRKTEEKFKRTMTRNP